METAGILTWSLLASCSACAASAQRYLQRKHAEGPFQSSRSTDAASLLDRSCEVQHAQVSRPVVWTPGDRASALLSQMHRYARALRQLLRTGVTLESAASQRRFYVCLDEPRVPAGLRASAKSCRYNGSIYQSGETFSKHDLFPSRQSNQCVMCTCSVSYIPLYWSSDHVFLLCCCVFSAVL